MTREIKFRAWNGERKVMVYQDTHTFMFNKFGFNVEQYNSYSDYDGLMSVSEPVVMQYTGLKDKNGKEIYEGDILSMHRGQYNSQVIWDTDGYVADHIGNGGSESITTWIEDCEIVGNIYENPELLN